MNWRISSAIYAAIIGLCLGFGGLALQMEHWKARLLPLLVGGFVLVLALSALIKENFGAASRHQSSSGESPSVRDADLSRYLASGAWLLGFFIAVYCLGFLVGISLYCLSYAKAYGAKWVAALALAVFTPLAVYMVFNVALRVELYRGLLFPP